MDLLVSVLGLVFALFLIIYGLQLLLARSKNLPPGPTPLPMIGNLHLLGDQPHKSMLQLAKVHGPIMYLRLGFMDSVVISSAALAKEVLHKQGLVFSSRKVSNAFHSHDHNKLSVMCLPAVESKWRSLRKVLSTVILPKNLLDANEHLRRRKVHELIDHCRDNCDKGEAVDIARATFRASLSMLSNTVFSKDMSDFAKELKDIVWNLMEETGKPNVVDYFPILEKFDPQGIYRRNTVYMGKMIKLLKGLIDERLEEGKSEINTTGTKDVLDVLLDTIKENPEINRTHIERLCLDIFVAGIDTTSSTVEWAMAEALKKPEAMKRAKLELAEVIGKGRVINETDIPRLPFLQCMVKETMRLHPSIPLVIRKVDKDAQVSGYTVPKDAQVLVNVWAIGRDAESWPNPLEFKPERFLKSQVDVLGTDFELLPFGAGRRICPGVPLAMRQLPVLIGSLLNMFDWELEGGLGPEELGMEEKFGLTLQKAIPLRAVPIPLS